MTVSRLDSVQNVRVVVANSTRVDVIVFAMMCSLALLGCNFPRVFHIIRPILQS
jgi:hypothetical protein